MTLKLILLIVALVLSVGFAAPVAADQLDEGEDAANRGDYVTALRLMRPLADEGIADAQYDLGSMYSRGWGVTQDDVEAAKWFHKAAVQGDVNAQAILGMMYDQGRGVQQDYNEAAKLSRMAADQNNAAAQAM